MMSNAMPDSVSNIHRRWSLTRINPSSYKISYGLSLLFVSTIIFIIQVYHVKTDQIHFLYSILLGQIALTGANFLDFVALQRTPLNKISKVFHVSAFANILWLFTIILGVLTDRKSTRLNSSHVALS